MVSTSEPSEAAEADPAVRLDASSADEGAEDDAAGAEPKQGGCSAVRSRHVNASLWSLGWIVLLLLRRRVVLAR